MSSWELEEKKMMTHCEYLSNWTRVFVCAYEYITMYNLFQIQAQTQSPSSAELLSLRLSSHPALSGCRTEGQRKKKNDQLT